MIDEITKPTDLRQMRDYLVKEWKPSFKAEEYGALIAAIYGPLQSIEEIHRASPQRIFLIAAMHPPFILSIEEDGAPVKFGIRCNFEEKSAWLGGVTHPDKAIVQDAFDKLVSVMTAFFVEKSRDGKPAVSETDWEIDEKPVAEFVPPPVSPEGFPSGGVISDEPPATNQNRITRMLTVGAFGLVGFGLLGLLIFLLHSGFSHGSKGHVVQQAQPPITIPAPPAVPNPASASHASSAAPAQVIGSSNQQVQSIPGVLNGAVPSIPIPGGGTITSSSQYKNFGMTPGPEMAPQAKQQVQE